VDGWLGTEIRTQEYMCNLANLALACVATVWDTGGGRPETGTHAQEYLSNLADMASAPYVARVWDTGGSQIP